MKKNHHIVPNGLMFEEVGRLLEECKNVTLKVRGASMLPFIKGGEDSIVISWTENIEAGDIVLAKVNGVTEYVIHRILEINESENMVVLMGDGNLIGTETCPKENIKGKVMKIIHPDGSATDCNSPKEKRKAQIWRWLRPIRRYLLYIYRKAGRI